MSDQITEDLFAEVYEKQNRIALISRDTESHILVDEAELPRLIEFLQKMQTRFSGGEPTPTQHPVNPFKHPLKGR